MSVEITTVEVKVTLKALAFREPDGGYSLIAPALPGCITEADDAGRIAANLVEAAEGWLEAVHDAHAAEFVALARDAEGPPPEFRPLFLTVPAHDTALKPTAQRVLMKLAGLTDADL